MPVETRQRETQNAERTDCNKADHAAFDYECTFPLAVGVLDAEIRSHDSTEQSDDSSSNASD